MFRAGMQAERRAQQAVAQQGDQGGRKVPQWLFLGHLFNEVILADSAARATSGASVKTSLLKRSLLATAAGLCLLYSIHAADVVLRKPHARKQCVDAAREEYRSRRSGRHGSSQRGCSAATRNLAAVAGAIDGLSTYNGAPFSLRWGLYSGSSMLPSVRRIYYKKFASCCSAPRRERFSHSCKELRPIPGPTTIMGTAYDSLKSVPADHIRVETILGHKPAGLSGVASARIAGEAAAKPKSASGAQDLAKLQFDFYAQDLPNGNPYSSDGDGAAVDRRELSFEILGRRTRLPVSAGGSGEEDIRLQFQSEISWHRRCRDRARWRWRGRYTRDGWKFMQDQIKRQNFGGEQWVLGAYQRRAWTSAAMESGILDRYTQGLHRAVAQRMRRSNVNPYASYAGRFAEAHLLTGSGAPLLALILVGVAEHGGRCAGRGRQIQGGAGGGAAVPGATVHRRGESKLQRRL